MVIVCVVCKSFPESMFHHCMILLFNKLKVW